MIFKKFKLTKDSTDLIQEEEMDKYVTKAELQKLRIEMIQKARELMKMIQERKERQREQGIY